jgi:DNA adenine methylase
LITSPIKAQGIKTKLVPWINSKLPKTCNRFIEPFCCTGVVSLNTTYTNYWLNDINPHVINFFKGIQTGLITKDTTRLYLESNGDLLSKSLDNGTEYYKSIRNRFNKTHDPFDFLFLSRSCFNGMIRFNKKGDYNTPFCKKNTRFSKSYITKISNQVNKTSEVILSNKWSFTNVDFREVIISATKDDIIYLDPPYLGRHVEYFIGWSEQDEEDLFKLLKKTEARFILSTWHHNEHRNNPSMLKYWKDFYIETSEHFYYLGGKIEHRKSMTEALVYNFKI